MQSMRFICARIIPTLHRDHLLSFPKIGKRAFCITNPYRYLPFTSSNVVYQCRLLHNDTIVNTTRISCNKRCVVFPSQQHCFIATTAIPCANNVSGAQAKSSESPHKEVDQTQNKNPHKTDKVSKEEAEEATEDLGDGDKKRKSLFVRFKENFKKYWYVMVPVHFVTSWMFFGGFYYLATLGVSPVPLLEYWGVPDKYISPVRDSSLGQLAVGLAFYKIATPIRYLTTLGLSGMTVKILAKRGKLPSSAQVKAMMKNKVKDIKDKKT